MDLPLTIEQEIAVGLEQLANGEAITFNDQSLKERFEQIKAEGRKLLNSTVEERRVMGTSPEETVNASEQSVGTRLTPGLCLFHVFFAVVWLLWIAVALLIGIHTDDISLVLCNLVFSLIYVPNVWVKWRQYQRVSSGAVIYARRHSLRLPVATSIIVFGFLTLLAVGATVFSVVFLQIFRLRYDIFRDDLLVFSTAAAVANVFLWGYVTYCWYRIYQERLQSKPQEVLSVPTEGVWPPPPMQRS
jgi:hypothetical protein